MMKTKTKTNVPQELRDNTEQAESILRKMSLTTCEKLERANEIAERENAGEEEREQAALWKRRLEAVERAQSAIGDFDELLQRGE